MKNQELTALLTSELILSFKLRCSSTQPPALWEFVGMAAHHKPEQNRIGTWRQRSPVLSLANCVTMTLWTNYLISQSNVFLICKTEIKIFIL